MRKKNGGDPPTPTMGGRRKLDIDWKWWTGVILLVVAFGVGAFFLGAFLAA